jgi:hypothetical protein
MANDQLHKSPKGQCQTICMTPKHSQLFVTEENCEEINKGVINGQHNMVATMTLLNNNFYKNIFKENICDWRAFVVYSKNTKH